MRSGLTEIVFLAMRRAPAAQHMNDPSVLALQQMPRRFQAAIYEPALELDSFGQTDGARAVSLDGNRWQ